MSSLNKAVAATEMKPVAFVFFLVCLCLLGSCAAVPGFEEDSGFRSNEIEMLVPAEPNGSIYQSNGNYMALFEDRRPRRIGDILTIVLDEQVSASKNSSSNASRSGSSTLETAVLPVGLEELADWGFDLSADTDFSGTGGSQANNRLTGTITVTVAQVLQNGNLSVTGEKQMMINQGTEYVRFSGVVNPRTVDGRNSVRSSEVANARIEYTGNGYISEAQRMGWLQRFFMNISPF